uniref:HAT C-terminal dimerisation domain-containing protein n=1 Tax=Ditylenchus dipsaci TaxID=166011 RepID=A0A915D5X9_9BILA
MWTLGKTAHFSCAVGYVNNAERWKTFASVTSVRWVGLSALSDQCAVGKTLINKLRGIDKFLDVQQRMEKAIDEKFLRLEIRLLRQRAATRKDVLSPFFDSLGIHDESVTKRPSTQLQLEINAYILEECQQPDVDCMEYWKNNCKIFSSLASVAHRFLSSPSTSVASEQLFSVAPDVLHYRRFNLAPKNAEMLVFLNKVLPLLYYQY